ncbi:MAG: NAD(+)/NADH kinase [Candidatus Woesearchaeota archaeon]|jgi:NAD+ kinase
MKKTIKKIAFYYDDKNKKAMKVLEEIYLMIQKEYPNMKLDENNPDVVFVLGGDGTMIKAIKDFHYSNTLFFGFNLGNVGFLTSVRDSKKFLEKIKLFLKGEYFISHRNLIKVEVERNGKVVFKDDVLNEIAIQNLIGMVNLDVKIDDFQFQNIFGTGVLVATPTGSTAYNLSAHGPVVMPNIECLILTELMDHNIPTPSLVISKDKQINIEVVGFRRKELFQIKQNQEMVGSDVLLISDGINLFSLDKGDKVVIKNNDKKINLIELEKNYFLSSLKDKFYYGGKK